ncbi:alpha-ketoglutarate-dependent dioxygenase AlkB [Nocardia asteroides]
MRPVPRVFALPGTADLYTELSTSVRWEDLGKGRRGATLTKPDEAGGVPLVRTTTRYGHPAQLFQPVHENLARRIQARAGLAVGFNTALIERYTNAYVTMGAHSDQALDLSEESSIAVYSCYRDPVADAPRRLVFDAKASGEKFDIPLNHHSVVVFSVATNRLLKHKIVLDGPARGTDNEWLGVTFRTAKTLIRFRDGHPHLGPGSRLTLADDDQRAEFYRLRRSENDESDFRYPPLTYTVSASDLLPPVVTDEVSSGSRHLNRDRPSS